MVTTYLISTNNMAAGTVFQQPQMSKAQANQIQRIQMDEKVMNQEEDIKREKKALLNASWTESLEESSQNKILKRKEREIVKELQLTNIALVSVRRVHLKQLLEQEQLKYERELQSIGLTLHKERI